MPFLFNEHETGCTPLIPCRNCKAARFLMDKLPPGDFEKFRRICGEDAPPNTTDYQRPISEFSDVLSSRAYNALLSGKIETIGDLVRHTEATLLRTPNFGRRSLLEIRELLARLGHKLGELPYEPQPVSSVS